MTTMDDTLTRASQLLRIEDEHVAHNYHPLDVVASGGWGAVLTDIEGAGLYAWTPGSPNLYNESDFKVVWNGGRSPYVKLLLPDAK